LTEYGPLIGEIQDYIHTYARSGEV